MSLPTSNDEFLLLHNPRCSKSRAALELLTASGVEFSVREYLQEPLDAAELGDLARRLGRPPAEFVRPGESAYREAGLDEDSDDEALLAAMAAHPILLERPILLRGDHGTVGRPPERVKELLP